MFALPWALATSVPATTMLAMNVKAGATPITTKLSSVPFAMLVPSVEWDFAIASCVLQVSIKNFQVRQIARSVFQDTTGTGLMTLRTIL